MKTIVIPDLHGKSFWKLILHIQEWDRVIFLGDYLDSFNITGLEQLHNLKEIIELKVKSKKEVILLLGNHDGYISPQINQAHISGYQPKMYHQFYQLLNDNKDLFQMAYGFDNYLCTHAGVSEEWLEKWGFKSDEGYTIDNIVTFINELWKYKPKAFDFDGLDNTGDDLDQTPIWIRPSSLIDSSQIIKAQGIIQVVGHTKIWDLNIIDPNLQGYILTDTFDTSQEYLIIDGNELIIKKI